MMQQIVLRPMSKQFLVNNAFPLLLLFFTVLFIGYDHPIVSLSCIITSIFFLGVLLLKWYSMKSISWIVTNEQVIYQRGLFHREKDFLELYRIVDFKEKESFLQRIINTKTVVIESGDRSHPILNMWGIDRKSDIITIIRERVEYNKQIKGVYEISNR